MSRPHSSLMRLAPWCKLLEWQWMHSPLHHLASHRLIHALCTLGGVGVGGGHTCTACRVSGQWKHSQCAGNSDTPLSVCSAPSWPPGPYLRSCLKSFSLPSPLPGWLWHVFHRDHYGEITDTCLASHTCAHRHTLTGHGPSWSRRETVSLGKGPYCKHQLHGRSTTIYPPGKTLAAHFKTKLQNEVLSDNYVLFLLLNVWTFTHRTSLFLKNIW